MAPLTLTDTHRALGKVGGASLATLLLIGALERNTRAVQSLETSITAQNTARVEQVAERQKELDHERDEREKLQAQALAVQTEQATTLRRLLELREADAAHGHGR